VRLPRPAAIGRSISYRGATALDRLAYTARTLWNGLRLRTISAESVPPVTLVVAGRNDDYMPDFGSRLEATLSWNLRFLAQEVVFVEWNPPPGRPLLAHQLAARFPTLRAYVVPSSIHASVCRNPAIPLLEFHAKNVGIRRALWPWIFVTNADAAVGLDTMVGLRRRQLDAEFVWTAQRIDINWRSAGKARIRLLDVLRRRKVIPYTPYGTGEFTLAHTLAWAQAGAYDERMDRHRSGCDTRGTRQMELNGRRLARAGTVYHLAHPSSCTEAVRPHHGEKASMSDLPYSNRPDWGLASCLETEIADRVWRLG
jgi:hypothetical protein